MDEAVKTVVVLAKSQRATAKELIDWFRARAAGYKAPKSVDFENSLPLVPSGKVFKCELRARYWQGEEREVG